MVSNVCYKKSMVTVYILLAIFFTWLVWIGYRSRNVSKDTKIGHFLIANRSVIGVLVAIGVVMSWVDATAFGYVGGMGYDNGWGVTAYALGASITFLLVAYLAPRIRTIAANGNMYMMTDIIRQKFSKRAGLISGIAVHLYFAFWMLVQFIVGPVVIQSLLGISTLEASIIMGGVVLIYLVLGGFRSQVYTDILQFGLFGALAVILLGRFIPSVHVWVAPLHTVGSLGVGGYISLFILSAASTVAAPDVWQRIYSARSEKDARNAMVWCAILMSIVYTIFAMFGMIVKRCGWAANSNGVPAAIFQHIVPHWFLPIAIVSFFAIIMSTIATTLFGASMAISNDILFSFGLIKHERVVFWQRIIMVIVIVSGVAITASNLNIISVVNYSLATCLVPLPVVLAVLYKIELSERAAFFSMLASSLVFIAGIAFGFMNGIGLLWPLAVGVPVLFLIEVFSRKKTA